MLAQTVPVTRYGSLKKHVGSWSGRLDDELPDLGPGTTTATVSGQHESAEAAEVERDRRIVAEVAAKRRAAGKPWTAEMEARMLAERAERRRNAAQP